MFIVGFIFLFAVNAGIYPDIRVCYIPVSAWGYRYNIQFLTVYRHTEGINIILETLVLGQICQYIYNDYVLG